MKRITPDENIGIQIIIVRRRHSCLNVTDVKHMLHNRGLKWGTNVKQTVVRSEE